MTKSNLPKVVSNPDLEIDGGAASNKALLEEEDNAATAEHVKVLIEDCKKLLLPDVDIAVGAWGLIDNDPVSGDSSQDDVDTILILTPDAYYVAQYDDGAEKVTQYQRVLLSNIEKIEFGLPEQTLLTSFGSRGQMRMNEHSMRISYRMPSEGTIQRLVNWAMF